MSDQSDLYNFCFWLLWNICDVSSFATQISKQTEGGGVSTRLSVSMSTIFYSTTIEPVFFDQQKYYQHGLT